MNMELSEDPRRDPSVRMYAAAANRPTSERSPRAATIQVGVFARTTASIWAKATGAEVLSSRRAGSGASMSLGSTAR